MKKRISAVVLVLAMVVSCMTGCGKKDALQAAVETAQSAKNMDATLKMDMSMKMSVAGQEQTLDMNMDGDMTIFTDPLKYKMNMSMKMAGQDTKMESYMAKEGENYMTYTNSGTTWSKVKVASADEMDKVKAQSDAYNVASFVKNKEDLKPGEDATENDKTYKTYTAVMTKEMMKEAMESSMGNSLDSLSSLTGGKLDKDKLDSILDSIKDVTYTIWVDEEEAVIYRVKYSMAEMMDSLMSQLFASMASGSDADGMTAEQKKVMKSLKIEIGKCDIDIVYKNYNEATDFEIPAEALAAKEATSATE